MTFELFIGNQAVKKYMTIPAYCQKCKETKLDQSEKEAIDRKASANQTKPHYLCVDCELDQRGVLMPYSHAVKCDTCSDVRVHRFGYLPSAGVNAQAFKNALWEAMKKAQICHEDNCNSHNMTDPPFTYIPLENTTIRTMRGE